MTLLLPDESPGPARTVVVVVVDADAGLSRNLVDQSRCLAVAVFLEPHSRTCHTVSWSLTSPFSTNMAISETKGQGWRAIPTQ